MLILPRAKFDPPSLESASHQRARRLVTPETTNAESLCAYCGCVVCTHRAHLSATPVRAVRLCDCRFTIDEPPGSLVARELETRGDKFRSWQNHHQSVLSNNKRISTPAAGTSHHSIWKAGNTAFRAHPALRSGIHLHICVAARGPMPLQVVC